MTERIEVGPVDELGPGERRIVSAGETSIGVLNVEGEYYAFENACCHQGGPVCEGRVRGRLEGVYEGPGEFVTERFSDRLTIMCPWHGWEYDLETGDHLGVSDIALATFEVTVDEGTVFLER